MNFSPLDLVSFYVGMAYACGGIALLKIYDRKGLVFIGLFCLLVATLIHLIK